MTGNLVHYERDDAVAVLTLNDPSRLNAVTSAMSESLIDALDRAEAEARAVVLRGAGRLFCAGGSLDTDGLTSPPRGADSILVAHFNPLMLRLRDLRVPLITSVQGAAVGFGMALACSGDIIIAGRSAYFRSAFRNVGLVPDGGATALLVRAVGRVRAMEMMLLGERIPAPTAQSWGLITRVVDDDDLSTATTAMATELSHGPTFALGLTRRLAWDATEQSFESQLAAEARDQDLANASGDFAEGVAAFLEKRSARFTGH